MQLRTNEANLALLFCLLKISSAAITKNQNTPIDPV